MGDIDKLHELKQICEAAAFSSEVVAQTLACLRISANTVPILKVEAIMVAPTLTFQIGLNVVLACENRQLLLLFCSHFPLGDMKLAGVTLRAASALVDSWDFYVREKSLSAHV